MTTFEEGQDPGERGIGESETPVSEIEKFSNFDYEESIRIFDAVMGEPDLEAETTIEEEIQEELEEELGYDRDEGMPKDDLFDVLSNSRRRTILRHMKVKPDETPVRLGELAEIVAAQENDKELDQVTSDERKRVYIALYQTHLPDIDRAGLVDFDSDRGLIDHPEREDDYALETINELLEDELYPEKKRVDGEYFGRVFGGGKEKIEGTGEWMHKDDFFNVLSNNRRRTTLRYMNAKPDETLFETILRYIGVKSDEVPFGTGELAEVVAAQENDKEKDDITKNERKRAYVGLYQTHLPDMDEIGLIDFDQDNGLIDHPEDNNYVLKSMNELLEDEVYPEDQMADEEYFERVFVEDEEVGYLSSLRQKVSDFSPL